VLAVQELRAAWTDAAASLDLLRSALRAQPEGRGLQSAIDTLRTSELRAAEEKIERFQRLLAQTATTPPPSSIGGPESLPGMRERFDRISAALDALRQRYPEYTGE
jgi:hypothetical protein